MNKIALGTVQFGLDYGINNKSGKISKREAFEILDYCAKCGIDTIDTAYLYGESEAVLGEYLKNNVNNFKIVSKLPGVRNEAEVKAAFNETLKRLNVESIYAYLYHDISSFKSNEKTWDVLREFKSYGKIKKIGFSLYYPDDVYSLLDKNINFNIVQVPYNIFDQRFEDCFSELKRRNVEIHVRSVFLQGLFFKSPEELKGKLLQLKNKIIRLKLIAKEQGMNISEVCLCFAYFNLSIDKVVIGVDSISHLNENIGALNALNKIKGIQTELLALREENEGIILPFNWQK